MFLDIITRTHVITFCIGFIAGILSVFVGVGGIIMLPLLMLSGIISDYKTVLGTMFFATISPVSLGAIYNFYKQKKIDFVVGAILGVGFFIGNFIASKYFIGIIADEVLYLLFSIYSLIISFKFMKLSGYIF